MEETEGRGAIMEVSGEMRERIAAYNSPGMQESVINEPTHVFLPQLDIFRFALVGHDDDLALFGAVVQFLRARPRLSRLDLGTCPWKLVRRLLLELTGLRVLRAHHEPHQPHSRRAHLRITARNARSTF
ncbi:hypothetical protein BGW80DRAFT_1558431 [Lactifluus volemus]|nr:hypothetical protein BGW80DRAFT_1558431 [Lactifluus volemus]